MFFILFFFCGGGGPRLLFFFFFGGGGVGVGSGTPWVVFVPLEGYYQIILVVHGR